MVASIFFFTCKKRCCCCLFHNAFITFDANVCDLVTLNEVKFFLHVDLAHSFKFLDEVEMMVQFTRGLLRAQLGAEVPGRKEGQEIFSTFNTLTAIFK